MHIRYVDASTTGDFGLYLLLSAATRCSTFHLPNSKIFWLSFACFGNGTFGRLGKEGSDTTQPGGSTQHPYCVIFFFHSDSDAGCYSSWFCRAF